jgi:hypothetical protein
MAGTISEICTECVQLIMDVPGYMLLLSLLTVMVGFITLVRFCQHARADDFSSLI